MATRKAASKDAGIQGIFEEKLAGSKLSVNTATGKLKFKLYDRAAAVKANGSLSLPEPAGGFVIPYFDLNGKQSKFWRYRYLEDYRPKGSFDALTDRKLLRYVQPRDTTSELYLPPLVDWAAIAKDKSKPLIITEGELKAACATAYTEFPCIGLGGVWSFKSTKQHAPLLPMFKQFVWDGRDVYIIYDSDAATNPKVHMAENALAYELTRLGANPYIVRLPPLPGGKKCGLDDYILANGNDLKPLIDTSASSWRAAQELHALNAEVMYIRNPGCIMRLDTRQRIAPRAFVEHAYSTRTYHEVVTTDKGTKMVERSAPKEWLRWPHRAEVERATYEPGMGAIVDNQLNVWPGWGVEPKRGDITPWKQLLDFIFAGDKAARTWFERWCACPLQMPGVKMYSSPVIWGREHGTGKSFVGYSLFKIYGANATEIGDKQLYESHNEWAENKQFVMGDEITGGDKRATSDRMKSIVTQQTLRLNPKYIPAYTVRDCINYYFTSNHPDSFFLEDDDRRFFIWEITTPALPFSFYKAYESWIGKPGVVGPGAAALFDHLLRVDLGDFDPTARAPATAAKSDMMSIGRSDLGAWVAQLKESPDTVLRVGGQIVPFALWRAEDLLRMYDPEGKGKVSVNGLARELRRQGITRVCNGNGVFTETDGQVRLYAVRKVPNAFNNKECGALYDSERQLPVKKEKFK